MREDHRPGEVGDRFGQDVRRVGDDDAAGARVRDVDVVVPDGDVGDDLQLRRRVDGGAIDRVGEQADERVLVGDPRPQFGRRDGGVARVEIHLAGRFELASTEEESAGHENVRHVCADA